MSSEAYIKIEIINETAVIEFFHPKSNSFPITQLNLLIDTFRKLGNDDSVKVIILKSAGNKVFSGGASFEELLLIDGPESANAFFLSFAKTILAFRNCPKFIIGCITGKVVGGGNALVTSCDYAVADESASLLLSEMSMAVGPFVIEPPIRRKIGLKAFSEMAMNPVEWKSPQWALEKGIYNSVTNSESECYEKTLEFAETLSRYSLEVIKDLKKIYWEGTENWDKIMIERSGMSGKLYFSKHAKELLDRFKSKS